MNGNARAFHDRQSQAGGSQIRISGYDAHGFGSISGHSGRQLRGKHDPTPVLPLFLAGVNIIQGVTLKRHRARAASRSSSAIRPLHPYFMAQWRTHAAQSIGLPNEQSPSRWNLMGASELSGVHHQIEKVGRPPPGQLGKLGALVESDLGRPECPGHRGVRRVAASSQIDAIGIPETTPRPGCRSGRCPPIRRFNVSKRSVRCRAIFSRVACSSAASFRKSARLALHSKTAVTALAPSCRGVAAATSAR